MDCLLGHVAAQLRSVPGGLLLNGAAASGVPPVLLLAASARSTAHLSCIKPFPAIKNPLLTLSPAHCFSPPSRRHFGLGLDLRCVYELDSSTPAKFSRHLTVRLPGHAFATNHAMGKFVAQVSSTLWRV